eukprot:CAMPEP_0184873442 /NCGR_PEP_ID=MMETSP0580-20130426/41846_1 /TAXON_ID=1118495 /ORGANISM="Dactyliosolen fragilissimus" /LENGTH=193 /DNA_ID=CAMNT_0027376349 /DNA_START=478 /DNA_END=1059 /DNA_ORIENTATION=+
MNWIKKVVIGLNLCPFADKPMQQSKIRTSVERGDNVEKIIASVLISSLEVENQIGTTGVVICPDLYVDNFLKYLDVVAELEEVLTEYDLDGHVQIAPFHPLFQFQGSEKDGVENLTNRSPYPMFHILRENDVSIAVDKIGGNASKIWKRNVKLLEVLEEEIGRERTEFVMTGGDVDGVEKILQKVRIEDAKEG